MGSRGSALKQGRGNLNVLFHFFVPYAVLLFGLLAVGLYAYERTSALVENQTKETAYTVLTQTKEILDRRFEEIETIAEQAASGTKARSFQYVSGPFDGTNPIRLMELSKDLFDYSLFNHFILNYYVVYPGSEMIVSPRSAYTLRQFYDLKFRYDGQSYEQWKGELTDRYRYRTFMPGQDALYEGKRRSVVTYVQSFGTKDRQALVLILIDNAQIQSLLRKLDSDEGGFAFIMDEQGQIISHSGTVRDTGWSAELQDGFAPVDIDGKRMLVTRTTSPYNGWTYVSAQSEAAVLAKVQYFRQLILTIIIPGLVLGLIAALLFAYRNSRPLWMILRMLPAQRPSGREASGLAARSAASGLDSASGAAARAWTSALASGAGSGVSPSASSALRAAESPPGFLSPLPPAAPLSPALPARNAWDYIRSSVMNLVISNDFLEEKLEQQVPLIRSGFYDRLLRGQFASNKDIAVAMEHSRQSWEGEYYAVGILTIAGYDGTYNEEMLTELEFRKIAVRDVIAKAYGRTVGTHDLGENQIALLMNGDAASPAGFLDDLRKILEELHRRLAGSLHVNTFFAVGGCYRQMTEISRSYEEARLLLQRQSWTEDRPVVCRDDESPALPAYYYPPDVEQRLINLVHSGNVAETEAVLSQIRENNLERGSFHAAVGRVLLGELSGTLLKCVQQLDKDLQNEELEKALLAAESGRSPKSAFEGLAAAFTDLCKKQNDRKKSHNKQLKDDLIRYLDEHYMQTDLSLNKLADQFQTSEAYISYFFKEQTGINFSDYLENVRMTHAKQLLAESDMAVNEIAAWVGYYSLNTFSRAFKRANGVSATEYRKMAKSRSQSGF